MAFSICSVAFGVYFCVVILSAKGLEELHGQNQTGGFTDMKKLIETIFKDYKTTVMPRLNNSHPIEVTTGMTVTSIVGLDTRLQVLTIRGYLTIHWTDFLLRWNPLDYGNITNIIIPENDVWTPDLTLPQSMQDSIYVGSEETYLRLSYDGRVRWHPAFTSDLSCEVDVTRYPLDSNMCEIYVTPWMHDMSAIRLVAEVPSLRVLPSVNHGQFDSEVLESDTVPIPFDGLFYSFLAMRLKLERKPAHVFISLMLPMFIIGLLNLVSFLVPPDGSSDKVGIALNNLLSTTVLISVLHNDLPDRSDKIPSIALYVVCLLVLAFLGVLGNTIVLLMYQRDEEHRHQSSPPSPQVTSTSQFPASCKDAMNHTTYANGNYREGDYILLQPPTGNGFRYTETIVKTKFNEFEHQPCTSPLRAGVGSLPPSKTRAVRLNNTFLGVVALGLLLNTVAFSVMIMR